MLVPLLSLFIIAVLTALFTTPWVIRLAKLIGAIDQPGGRKIHSKVTPRLGGLAVFVSMGVTTMAALLLFPEMFNEFRQYPVETGTVLLSLVIIFALGFRDDLKPLTPGVKFGVQLLVAALVYLVGFKISNITNPLGTGVINVELVDFPLTLLWIVGVTNAFNLIDGLDGLASGVATIAAISMFTVSLMAGEMWSAGLALIMAGALIGFLRYNFRPAKIFLGDSGSLLIGFSLALMSIQSTTKISTGFALLFPMLVLILPITDTLVSMARRFLGSFLSEDSGGRPGSLLHKMKFMFTPDKAHIHHQLLSLGLSHRNSVLLLYLVSAFFASGAFLLTQVDSSEASIALGAVFGVVLIAGVRRLQYHEIAIVNNGLILPVYERWIINRSIFLGLIDLFFVALSYGLSYLLIGHLHPGSFDLFINQTLVMVVSVQVAVLWISGLYREKLKQLGVGTVLGITTSVFYALVGSALVLILPGTMNLSMALQFLVLDFYILLTFILGIRIAYQVLSFWFNRNKRSGENVLIYGANENGTMLLHKINHSMDSRFKVVGFLDDDPYLEGKMIYGYPVLGTHWNLSQMLDKRNVESILICQPNLKSENFRRLKRIAEARGVNIKHLQIKLRDLTPRQVKEEKLSTSVDIELVKPKITGTETSGTVINGHSPDN